MEQRRTGSLSRGFLRGCGVHGCLPPGIPAYGLCGDLQKAGDRNLPEQDYRTGRDRLPPGHRSSAKKQNPLGLLHDLVQGILHRRKI